MVIPKALFVGCCGNPDCPDPDSYREGKGTTFTILLPLGKDHLMNDEITDQNESSKFEARLPDGQVLVIGAFAEGMALPEIVWDQADADALAMAGRFGACPTWRKVLASAGGLVACPMPRASL